MSFDPVVLFFLLGIIAGLLKSDLKIPSSIYDFLSVFLLLAIGLKGGVELSKFPISDLAGKVIVVTGLGLILPCIAFPVLRKLGRFERADASSIAAHYGSVSVGTYAVALAYLDQANISYESYITLFLVVLEMPAIIVGVLLARGINRNMQWGRLAHEIFAGKAIVCLLGGIMIGWIGGAEGLIKIQGFFIDLFPGALAIFLLEMGLICASQISTMRRHGLFLIGFGIVMPLFSSCLGCALGWALGLSVGGTALLGILAASASYIAVPAAMRISVPEANPTLSLSASLGITFPFNVMLGIPLYLRMAQWIHS